MTDESKIKWLLKQGNGMFTASQATEIGIHRQQLTGFVKAGLLERAERGIYISPGEHGDTLFWMQQRAQKIVYSHETALFLHRMIDSPPLLYSITVPSSYKASAALKKYCAIFYIKQELIDLGKTKKDSMMGNSIVTYDLERTLCDVIRSRNKMDSGLVVKTLKNYARSGAKDLQRLYKYAENFGIEKILHHYLRDVMLEETIMDIKRLVR